MILVITGKRDGHIGPVSRHFDDAGVPWVRINLEDLATNVEMTVDPSRGAGRILVKDSGREVDLQRVTAVWYRKPDPIDVSHFRLEGGALDYVEAELTEIAQGLYALLNRAYWINNPFQTRLAHRKLLQLKVATDVGLAVPRTVVTNRSAEALDFASSISGDLAIKSLGAISVIEERNQEAVQYGIFTRRIDLSELRDASDKVQHMPTLFQEFIEKDHELRITCVGEQVFACQIKPRTNDLTADDYRFDTKNLIHSPIDCPELHSRLHGYMEAFGLNFGCFDIAVTKSGEPIFLECNPNGQWLWVEHLTGLPIAEAIARQLIATVHARDPKVPA